MIQEDGIIVDVHNGFPERELGKYKLEYYENNTEKPFKYFYKSITSQAPAIFQNTVDDIKKLPEGFLLKHKFKDFDNNNTNFQVLKIYDNQGIISGQKNAEISIIYDDQQKVAWSYRLDNEKFKLGGNIPIESFFEGKWNNTYKAVETSFEDIEKDENVINTFINKYSVPKVEIHGYGTFHARLINVPVVPTEETKEKWFIYLLKNKISKYNSYLSEDDLKQEWDNLFHTTPQIRQLGTLPYDYDQILRVFDKKTEMHWLIQTTTDLNPFVSPENSINNPNVCPIQEQKNANLSDVLNFLNLANATNLIILDRYINTPRHFNALFAIKKNFPDLSITIVSTDFYNSNEKEEDNILKECKMQLINIIIKTKNDIPHDRYWKVNEQIYTVSKSIDFISVEEDKIAISHTVFTPLAFEQIDTLAQNLYEEISK